MLTRKTGVLTGAVVGAVVGAGVGAVVGAIVGPISVDSVVWFTHVGYASSGSNPSAGAKALTLKTFLI